MPVMDFELMVRFFIAPCACDQVNEVVDTVRDMPDFQSAYIIIISVCFLSKSSVGGKNIICNVPDAAGCFPSIKQRISG